MNSEDKLNIPNIYKRYSFFIAFILASISAYWLNSDSFINHSAEINVESFQETLYNEEDKLISIIDIIAESIGKNDEDKWLLENAPKIIKTINDDDLSFLIYKNDSVFWWTNNEMVIDSLTPSGLQANPIVFLGNAWYHVENKVINDYNIFGFILIKKKYPFENPLLKNNFASCFNLPPNYKLFTDSTGIENAKVYTIYDTNGEILFYLQHDSSSINSYNYKYLSLFAYSLALVFLLLLLIDWFSERQNRRASLICFVLFVSSLFAIRYLLFLADIQKAFSELSLFSPIYFAESSLSSSLGDFLLNTILILAICYYISKNNVFDNWIYTRIFKKSKIAFTVVSVTLSVMFFAMLDIFLKGLILNSTINFEINRIFDISVVTFFAFLILSLLLFSFMLFIDKLIRILNAIISTKEFIIISLISSLLVFILLKLLNINISLYSILFFYAFTAYFAWLRFGKHKLIYSTIIFILFLSSLYAVTEVTRISAIKEKGIKKVLAINLSTERDPLAETFLDNINKKLLSDSVLYNKIFDTKISLDEIYTYVSSNYFSGFWIKYNMQLFLCGKEDSILNELSNESVCCREFFDEMIHENGQALPSGTFYFIDNMNGRISYLGEINFTNKIDSGRLSLFIDLNTKLQGQALGYPELLIEGNKRSSSNLDEFSYAKYKDGVLVAELGEFPYSLTSAIYETNDKEFASSTIDGFDHLIYKPNSKITIIVSNPTISLLDILIILSYIFVFFHIVFTIITFLHKFPSQINSFQFDFKNKIQFSIVSTILLSLLVIGGITIYSNIEQYNTKNSDNIKEKMQSVLVELEHKLANLDTLDSSQNDYITYLLIKFSNVFYTDINLYSTQGDLLASSRPEIFENALIGTKMNAEAFWQMKRQNKANFVHDEKIGELNYLSAYVPFINNQNKVLAYLNLPYFTNQKTLKKEMSALITAVANIYALLILLTILIAILISNKITKPLRLIHEKMKAITLGKPNEKIDYSSKDEIGKLINDYNRMIDELHKSANLLLKSERESAWREMAKQIAHEIKNPLTPMRLHLQYLQKIKSENPDEFTQRFDKVANILISQIDALSAIATEFSNFAKMPTTENSKINLIDILKKTTDLFLKDEKLILQSDFNNLKEAYVFADEEKIKRVFINLINNAIQSITKGSDIIVEIKLTKSSSDFVVEIKDNGAGVPDDLKDKLFIPNFTTKSSGSGLGLAISKNIIENANGSIWFTTEKGIGSSFFVRLPEYIESNN